MKIVLDIETIQAPREQWARLVGKCQPLTENAAEEYDLFAASEA